MLTFLHWLITFLTITEQFSAMIGTDLCGSGSCQRHSERTDEMHAPLRTIPKEDTLRR